MKKATYEPDGVYHIYNRANGWENIFLNDDNYRYFLQKFGERLSGVLDIYAYCLMPNHFHFLVKIKPVEALDDFIQYKTKQTGKAAIPASCPAEKRFHYIVHRQFANFLTGYAKAFNKYHNRRGSLFQQNSKRKLVYSERYMMNALVYLHLNPFLHGFTNQPEEWPYTSYGTFLSDDETTLPRAAVLDWFGGRTGFVQAHLDRMGMNLALNPAWEE